MDELKYKLLLADDDEDDCDFFREALDELSFFTKLETVNDGVELMDFLLIKKENLPDLLFLDLNMPRKNGLECLNEIKQIDKFQQLPIVIFSTSLDTKMVDLMYEKGAIYYIRKPGDFTKLKKVIEAALTLAIQNNFKQPIREQFILHP